MRMYDVIEKKRDGGELTDEEIDFFISGYVSSEIPDYQASALAMAIFYEGMTPRETAKLTMAMAESGDMMDLSAIPGIKVDKHSTGGVGDKTTLVVAPIVASLGVKVAKMSGRGLGHTGGTLDKLESIPGLSVEISEPDFFEQVNKIGVAVAGQTGNLVPADKKLYALRDVTATVDSVPLIASSIMSKKIASGSNCILLDVKCGSGAFMKTVDAAIELAEAMVSIGEHVGRTTAALITGMDRPLGKNIGNALEVSEAVATLRGEGPEDLTAVCIELAANMLHLAGKGSVAECRDLAQGQIANGEGLAKLVEMVTAQGGDAAVIWDTSKFDAAPFRREVLVEESGYISAMNAERVGIASVALGAGREKKGDPIDMAAGIILERKTGDYVEKGEVLATLLTSDEKRLDDSERIFREALSFGHEQPVLEPLFFARVSRDGVEKLA
ncbi:pyrimidine-nucleoside phosphorylase [Lancefieldella sp. Marseille-Q7238]|uniref:pyrimidine-nucleoside phosphorylase n=1 Tax=Lancefieldella sp. Marseille-Q7238 TaxID=3022127 RepID=UPI0024A92DE4|nr:pyrimidine-nucleoside phosphorylase [Lancefieldella sp. Marseille-Q7238]